MDLQKLPEHLTARQEPIAIDTLNLTSNTTALTDLHTLPPHLLEEEQTLLRSKPKRPTNAYACYMKCRRPDHAKLYPELTFIECTKNIAAEWALMQSHTKQLYKGMALQKRGEWELMTMAYKQEVAEFAWKKQAVLAYSKYVFQELAVEFYMTHLNQVNCVNAGKAATEQAVTPSTGSKITEPVGGVTPAKPKRGKTSFLYFSDVMRPEMVASNPGKTSREVTSLIGERWRTLGAAGRAPYMLLANDDTDRYLQEMARYTENLKRVEFQQSKLERTHDEQYVKDALLWYGLHHAR